MSVYYNLDDVADEATKNEPILKREALFFTDGPVDLYWGTLIISGDIGPGGVVRGRGNVVVNGSIMGNARMPIQIEVDGDVVVKGTVSYASLDASWVYVGEEALDVQINARLGLQVGGNLGAARVRVGEYDLERKKIDHLDKCLKDAESERDAAERKLRLEEKRVDRMFKNTRVMLAPNVGRILQAKRNRLVINLAPIYESLEGRQEQEIDHALREFFAKAVVGLLTRANQHFLVSKNRHRKEIFKGIVRDVHDLFFRARKFDKQTLQCVVFRKQMDEAIEGLNGRSAPILVRGKCRPDLSISIVLPEVTVSDAGKVMVSGDMARMQVLQAQDGGLDVACVSALGLRTSHVLDADALQRCQISMTDGEVVWSAMDACEIVDDANMLKDAVSQ